MLKTAIYKKKKRLFKSGNSKIIGAV